MPIKIIPMKAACSFLPAGVNSTHVNNISSDMRIVSQIARIQTSVSYIMQHKVCEGALTGSEANRSIDNMWIWRQY